MSDVTVMALDLIFLVDFQPPPTSLPLCKDDQIQFCPLWPDRSIGNFKGNTTGQMVLAE